MKVGEVVRVRGSYHRIGIIISISKHTGFNRFCVMWNDGTVAKNVGGKWIEYICG